MTEHKHVNWHSATVDAIKIDLRDYADILEYQDEYTLSNGAHRIDLLLIRKKPGISQLCYPAFPPKCIPASSKRMRKNS
ncbi:MAG: hypothetical protein NC242_03135 [Roseburia sp.]|nr:hypothetical protein [Roseburia sp.]